MKLKDKKVHPALVLFVLTIVIMIISSVGGILNLETTYYNVNSVSGKLETQVITINNLFNRTGLQFLVSNMLPNFINFAPLGTLILGLMGVGVAYKSGFLNAFFKLITKDKSKKMFTFLVVFLVFLGFSFFISDVINALFCKNSRSSFLRSDFISLTANVVAKLVASRAFSCFFTQSS